MCGGLGQGGDAPWLQALPEHTCVMNDLCSASAPLGGETAFPQSNAWIDESLPGRLERESGRPWSPCAAGHVAVPPRKGDALLFFSLKVRCGAVRRGEPGRAEWAPCGSVAPTVAGMRLMQRRQHCLHAAAEPGGRRSGLCRNAHRVPGDQGREMDR